MDARARVRECAHPRWMIVDARAHSHSIVDGGARARGRGGDATRTGEENNIYIYTRSRVARAGETRRGIEETRLTTRMTVVRLLTRGGATRSIRFDLILSRWVDYKSAIDAVGAVDSTRRARRRRRRRRRARADGTPGGGVRANASWRSSGIFHSTRARRTCWRRVRWKMRPSCAFDMTDRTQTVRGYLGWRRRGRLAGCSRRTASRGRSSAARERRGGTKKFLG